MTKSKPKYECHMLIIMLRLLGFKKMSKRLKEIAPVKINNSAIVFKSSYNYRWKKNRYKILKNTPLHVQLDLIAWDAQMGSTKDFKKAYYALKGEDK